MYDEIVKSIDINEDELQWLIDVLENYNFSTNGERLLISGLLDKLNEE
jgi:hypothetical protein